MRTALFTLALFGSLSLGATAHAERPIADRPSVQPIYWNGGYADV